MVLVAVPAEVAGVPESALPADVAGRLPATTAAPPWRCVVDAVLWWHRAAPGAADVIPGGVPAGARALPVTVAALVRYRSSPVGAYSEVFASPVLLAAPAPSVMIPFIAVDSLASVAGGRAHWALPKALASFAWEGYGAAVTGNGWTVDVTTTTRGPRLPLAGVLPTAQPWPDGVLRCGLVRTHGWSRVAAVDVASTGASLPSWLLAGRHRALVLTGARMTVGASR